MFIIHNDIQYRVICVPADGHWSYVMHYDNIDDARQHAAALCDHPFDAGDRYYVTRIAAADSLSAALSVNPPAPVD